MNKHSAILQWATETMLQKGHIPQGHPEIIVESPWSYVIRLSTSKGLLYLKQPVPRLSQEANLMRLLAEQLNASVPTVIASNASLHCFLMEDAGQTLRSYLKGSVANPSGVSSLSETAQTEWLIQAILGFTSLQRTTETHLAPLFALHVPDWRLHNFLGLYNEIIEHTGFLKSESLSIEEIQRLQALSPVIAAEVEELMSYQVPDAIVQSDFNTNNVLYKAR